MGFLLILLLVFGRRGTMRRLPNNSRFGEFNSRLGRREFPVCAATGIRLQGLDLAYRFHVGTAVIRGKSTKFPVRREKPGILLPLAEPAATQPTDNDADLRFSGPIVPLFADRLPRATGCLGLDPSRRHARPCHQTHSANRLGRAACHHRWRRPAWSWGCAAGAPAATESRHRSPRSSSTRNR